MQPSGPVPRLETAATGSGPHDERGVGAGKVGAANGSKPPTPEVGPKVLEIPANQDEAMRAWNTVLDELDAARKVSLAALFHHARVMTWTEAQIELGFPLNDHSMGDMARDRTDELAAIIRTLGPAQKNVRVSIRLLDASESQTAGARSILETTRERTSIERSKREAEAREHPITKHVLQTFGAQIKEIKTDV